MTLTQMNYIITISETGSLNKAAEALYISQPSLTNAVKELEKELGIIIFNRSGRGVTLTNDGTEFLMYARQIYGQYESVVEKYSEGGSYKKKFGVSTQHYSFAVKAFVDMVQKFDVSEYEFAIRDSLTRMILCIAQNMNAPGDSDMPHLAEVRIKDMLGWIDRNLKDEITVSGIAGSANICVRECQRIFSQYVHYRPMEYVQRRRITLAAELLRTTHRQVTDIALECGFSSVSYFIKQFKNIVGCTPTGYRKKGGDSEK